jgi:cob(I)alamin adenosyltransferase
MKIFKQASISEEIAEAMEQFQTEAFFNEKTAKDQKRLKALAYLDSASKDLDIAGMHAEAEIICKFIEKIATIEPRIGMSVLHNEHEYGEGIITGVSTTSAGILLLDVKFPNLGTKKFRASVITDLDGNLLAEPPPEKEKSEFARSVEQPAERPSVQKPPRLSRPSEPSVELKPKEEPFVQPIHRRDPSARKSVGDIQKMIDEAIAAGNIERAKKIKDEAIAASLSLPEDILKKIELATELAKIHLPEDVPRYLARKLREERREEDKAKEQLREELARVRGLQGPRQTLIIDDIEPLKETRPYIETTEEIQPREKSYQEAKREDEERLKILEDKLRAIQAEEKDQLDTEHFALKAEPLTESERRQIVEKTLSRLRSSLNHLRTNPTEENKQIYESSINYLFLVGEGANRNVAAQKTNPPKWIKDTGEDGLDKPSELPRRTINSLLEMHLGKEKGLGASREDIKNYILQTKPEIGDVLLSSEHASAAISPSKKTAGYYIVATDNDVFVFKAKKDVIKADEEEIASGKIKTFNTAAEAKKAAKAFATTQDGDLTEGPEQISEWDVVITSGSLMGTTKRFSSREDAEKYLKDNKIENIQYLEHPYFAKGYAIWTSDPAAGLERIETPSIVGKEHLPELAKIYELDDKFKIVLSPAPGVSVGSEYEQEMPSWYNDENISDRAKKSSEKRINDWISSSLPEYTKMLSGEELKQRAIAALMRKHGEYDELNGYFAEDYNEAEKFFHDKIVDALTQEFSNKAQRVAFIPKGAPDIIHEKVDVEKKIRELEAPTPIRAKEIQSEQEIADAEEKLRSIDANVKSFERKIQDLKKRREEFEGDDHPESVAALADIDAQIDRFNERINNLRAKVPELNDTIARAKKAKPLAGLYVKLDELNSLIQSLKSSQETTKDPEALNAINARLNAAEARAAQISKQLSVEKEVKQIEKAESATVYPVIDDKQNVEWVVNTGDRLYGQGQRLNERAAENIAKLVAEKYEIIRNRPMRIEVPKLVKAQSAKVYPAKVQIDKQKDTRGMLPPPEVRWIVQLSDGNVRWYKDKDEAIRFAELTSEAIDMSEEISNVEPPKPVNVRKVTPQMQEQMSPELVTSKPYPEQSVAKPTAKPTKSPTAKPGKFTLGPSKRTASKIEKRKAQLKEIHLKSFGEKYWED